MKKHHGAVFSELTYQMLAKNNRDTNIANMNQKLQDEGMGGWEVSPNFTGRDISTFINDTKKQVVIAHRGTDTSGVKTKQDVSSDVLLGLGRESDSKAFNKRRNKTDKILKQIPEDYTVYGAGHSLGGATMAHTLEKSTLARNRFKKVRLYNAGASPFQSSSEIGKKKKAVLDEKVVHHRTRNDLVSKSLLINNRYGKVKTQDTSYSSKTKFVPGILGGIFGSVEALDAHKLHHFKKKKAGED